MRNPFTTRTAKSATTKRSLTLLGVLALLATIAGFAIAAPRGPASPSITSGPSGATRATSASFAFRGERGVTFECKLDGASFRACTSPQAYAGPLGSGSHTFQVRAKNARGQTSSPTSRTWTIDTTAPRFALYHPDHGEAYGVARWDDGCPGDPRMCGDASDPSGVASVSLSVRRVATGLWWNGRAFASASEQFLSASGRDSWRLSMPLPSADGAYVVRVRAADALGNATPTGAILTETFTVDRTPPPAPQLTDLPPSITNLDYAMFGYTNSEPDVTWECKVNGHAYQECTNPVHWWDLHDGLRTFSVRAVDAAGNAGPETSYRWRVDTNAPPRPRIVQKPTDPTSDTSATFAFTDSERGVGFECRLDGAPAWSSCTSPTTYTGLAGGRHTFAVRAVDAAGNRSGSADYAWSIEGASSGLDFTIRGGYGSSLAPGLSGPLALTIENPNGEAIFVTSLTVTIQPGSTRAGCDGPANLAVTQSDVSEANPLTVPANGSVTLPAGGVSAPQVEMLNLPTNQDACKGALFTFNYSGSAHS